VHRVGNAILGESDPDPAPGVAVQKDDSSLFEGWWMRKRVETEHTAADGE